MFEHIKKIRVRYAETDQMGYMYYGNYAQFYEVGRVEMLRSLGMTYRSMEESGIMMPVLDLKKCPVYAYISVMSCLTRNRS